MITTFDDYPVHQTAEPLAVPGTGDRNYYDRYFFNGYDREGRFFFAVALGLYPNRKVVDAAFSVLYDGVQRSVHASGRAPLDRSAATAVGPITVEVLTPLRLLRVRVDAPEQGLSADLTFTARTPAVEEPRFTRHGGALHSLVLEVVLAHLDRIGGTQDVLRALRLDVPARMHDDARLPATHRLHEFPQAHLLIGAVEKLREIILQLVLGSR